MKKIISINLLFVLSCICMACTNRTAVIDGILKNSQDSLYYLQTIDGITINLFEMEPVHVNKDGSFQIRITSGTPEMLTLYLHEKGKIGTFYLTPGSHNTVIIDPQQEDSPLSFSGTNRKENEIISRMDIDDYFYGYYYRSNPKHELRGDSSARSVLGKIDRRIERDRELINDPSLPSSFRKKMEQLILITYSSLFLYAYVGIDDSDNKELKNEWYSSYEKLARTIHFDNPEIVSSPHFYRFIKNHFWWLDKREKQPFDTSDEGITYFADLFYTHLSGKSQEAALAMLIADDYAQEDYSAPIVTICKEFYNRFPNSRLKEKIQKVEQSYNEFFKQRDNTNIQFINGENISTFQDAIAPFAGKVIYTDIWATWCGPCRASFQHLGELRKFAKENDIVLLYISIDNPGNESKWKQMAKFYNLEGQHIRTNEALNEELHVLFGNNRILAIPRYIIIDKSGNIHNPKASKPDDMDKLKEQLKTIL